MLTRSNSPPSSRLSAPRPIDVRQASTAPRRQALSSLISVPSRRRAPNLRRYVVERLGTREVKRRLWHMLPGLAPILWWFLPHGDPLWTVELCLLGCLAVGQAALTAYWSRTFSRVGERSCLAASVGYASLVYLGLLLFPDRAELAMTVFAVLAFGDGSATLGGLLWRGPRLPWNPRKTWTGLFCFLLVATPIATLYYWGESRPGVSWSVALACGTAATLAGALAESIPSRINDNIRVGAAALIAVVLIHTCVLGW